METRPQRNTNTLIVSYRTVRRAIGLIGLILPVALGLGGYLIFGVPLQENLSQYYYTPLRDVFVGLLFAIAMYLFAYKGYGKLETWTANIAGFAALGIAIFPLDPDSNPLFQKSIVGYLHTLCGAVFFLTLSVYSLYHFPTAIKSPQNRIRNRIYYFSGLSILFALLMIAVYFFSWGIYKDFLNHYRLLFWLELICIWSFAIAWLTKSRAIVTEILLSLVTKAGQSLKKQ